MIDLETMGTEAGCAIVSIGAVEFDPYQGILGREFYQVISLESCDQAGMTIDPATVNWWIMQSQQAREALMKDPQHIAGVLVAFSEWLNPDTKLWSHGADFDVPILAVAYRITGLELPWQRRRVRDTRTVLDLADMKMGSHVNGHHALEDAKHQAGVISQALQKILASRPGINP